MARKKSYEDEDLDLDPMGHALDDEDEGYDPADDEEEEEIDFSGYGHRRDFYANYGDEDD